MTQKIMINILIKKCVVCERLFGKPPTCSIKSWETRKNCSKECQNKYWAGKPSRHKTGSKNSVPAWNKGVPCSEEQKKVLSEKLKIISKEKGFGKWMTGKKLSVETRQKQREANLRLIAEGKHNFYIDGRTPERVSIRHSLDYKLWREAVFKRDNFTCQCCNERGGYLEAHHIKSFSEYPDLRFAIDNGISFCQMCHAKTDPLRARTLTKTQCQL